MTVSGIDKEKCNNCGLCAKDCPARLFTSGEDVHHNDPYSVCLQCGHCIAICPEEAIQFPIEGIFEDETYTSDPPSTVASAVKNPDSLIDYEQLHLFLASNRSMRQFKAEAIPPEVQDKLWATARFAASGGNTRSWTFVKLDDPEQIRTLAKGCAEVMMSLPGPYGVFIRSVLEKNPDEDMIFRKAPLVMVISTPTKSGIEGVNTGIIGLYMQLAAQSLGIGSLWVGWAQAPLNISKDLALTIQMKGHCWGVIAFGYPRAKYQRLPPRKPLRIKTPEK
ncbi:MAG: nitroreductase family protein [Candidatus Thorarchaeota archaeon]|jgi:nitroreductase/NAD-dependent dihydropyrimidine dehydrogenase PreA subunit